MNFVLAKAGYAGTNSDAAKSFAYYGHRISSPQVGAIAVLTRGKRGGHVGVVTGIDPHGNPIIISGNHGHRVGEAVYPRSRVIAYVMPTESRPLTQVADRAAPAARAARPDRRRFADRRIAGGDRGRAEPPRRTRSENAPRRRIAGRAGIAPCRRNANG